MMNQNLIVLCMLFSVGIRAATSMEQGSEQQTQVVQTQKDILFPHIFAWAGVAIDEPRTRADAVMRRDAQQALSDASILGEIYRLAEDKTKPWCEKFGTAKDEPFARIIIQNLLFKADGELRIDERAMHEYLRSFCGIKLAKQILNMKETPYFFRFLTEREQRLILENREEISAMISKVIKEFNNDPTKNLEWEAAGQVFHIISRLDTTDADFLRDIERLLQFENKSIDEARDIIEMKQRIGLPEEGPWENSRYAPYYADWKTYIVDQCQEKSIFEILGDKNFGCCDHRTPQEFCEAIVLAMRDPMFKACTVNIAAYFRRKGKFPHYYFSLGRTESFVEPICDLLEGKKTLTEVLREIEEV